MKSILVALLLGIMGQVVASESLPQMECSALNGRFTYAAEIDLVRVGRASSSVNPGKHHNLIFSRDGLVKRYDEVQLEYNGREAELSFTLDNQLFVFPRGYSDEAEFKMMAYLGVGRIEFTCEITNSQDLY